MPRPILFAALAVILLCASVASGQATITALSDSRSGTIALTDGFSDPQEDGFASIPGVINGPMDFEKYFVAGGWESWLLSSSHWTCLGPGDSITGFRAKGALGVVKPTGGLAVSKLHTEVSFAVAGAGSGIQAQFFMGAAGENFEFTCTLIGPNLNVTWPRWPPVPLNLVDGVYTLTIDADVSADPRQTAIKYLEFDVALLTGVGDCPGLRSGPIIDPMTGHVYAILDKGHWNGANLAAKNLGGDLVTIDNYAENQFVLEQVLHEIPPLNFVFHTGGWIGLNDVQSEGVFVWASGQAPSFTHWVPGQPDDWNNGEDAVEMNANGFWNDNNSSFSERYACVEYPSLYGCGARGESCFAPHGAPGCDVESCCNLICGLDSFCCAASWDRTCADAANKLCDPGIVFGPVYNPETHHRYYLLDTCAWTEGEKKAQAMNGHLFTSVLPWENMWVYLNVAAYDGAQRRCFIGLNDQALEGTFRWFDNTPVGWMDWDIGEPNGGDGDHFVELTEYGRWNDTEVTGGPAFTTHAIVEVPCTGDIDDSGAVDGADLAQLLGAWNTASPALDLDADGVVSGADLAILLGSWGSCGSSNCCVAHRGTSCDMPGCATCVCSLVPECCDVIWDDLCASLTWDACFDACGYCQ